MGTKLKKICIIISCIILITLIIIVPFKEFSKNDTENFRNIVLSVSKQKNNNKTEIKKELLYKINDKELKDSEKGNYYLAYIVYNLVFPDFSEVEKISEDTEKLLVKEKMYVQLSYYYFYLAFMYSQNYDYNKAYVNIYKANELASELYAKNKSNYVIELLTSTKYLQASIEADLELKDISKQTYEEALKLEKDYNLNNYFDNINSKIKFNLNNKNYKKVIELSTDLKRRMDSKDRIEILYFLNDMYLSEAYINLGETKRAKEILKNYKDDNLTLNELSYKYNVVGLLEISEGNYEKALKIRKNEFKYLKKSNDYRGQLSDIESILELCKKTNKKDEMIEWIDKYREVLDKASSLKGIQYLIGSLGDIELQNVKYNNKILELESKNLTYIVIIIIIISLLTIIIIAIANRNKRIKNEILSSDIDVLSNQLKTQYEHYNNIKAYQEEVRRLWHDMKHHTNLLNTLLEKGEYEECKKYLNSMSNTINLNRSKALTKHSILDAILANKQKICKEKNINLTLDIKVPENLNIDNFDLCVIYKNLLDNAIEASFRLEEKERYINVKSTIMNKYLYIEILNSKSNSIVKSKGKFISSKTDEGLHGVGISSVKRSIEKYDGNIKFEYDDKWFKVTALLKNEIKQ